MAKAPIIELKVEGMDCANCAASITKFLERKGLEEVYVNFQTKEVRFQENENLLNLDAAVAGIRKLGFSVVDENRKEAWWNLRRRLISASIFTFPLLLHHFLMMMGSGLPFLHHDWVQLLICIPVFLIGIEYFGLSAWRSIRNRTPNMDVLIFIGSSAAFIYSIIGTILQEHSYIFYETAATIITLVLMGNWMEHRAVKRTTSAIGDLTALQDREAKVKKASGSLVRLNANELKLGDQLVINSGDYIPADGKIIEGAGYTDESMISGESKPVSKRIEDFVIGGTLLKEGNLLVEVNAIGAQSVLGQMIELVKTAQKDKPEIQRLADKISEIFVPVVLGISILTFFLGLFAFQLAAGKALMNAIAVLVISCPCAMGLATPTAVMVGVGRLAKNGILIKGGHTLEVLSKIKHIIFDKTGTLTKGEFEVAQLDYYQEDTQRIDSIIYTLEQHSSHPIATSLIKYFETKGLHKPKLDWKIVEEIKGIGLHAVDHFGNEFYLGSHRIKEKAKKMVLDGVHAENMEQEHSTSDNAIFLSENGALLAKIKLADQLKDKAKALVDHLKEDGIEPIILSGDHSINTQKVAEQLGIGTYYAQQLPEEKLEIVSAYRNKGLTAMVGDGINDAPALAKADLGISLSNASQVAIQSAQLILMNGRLDHLGKAMKITKHTVLTIKQNLFWAFAYNIVAIPIAAMGFLNPMWGALFMAVSDVVVIGNSIRLRYKRIR